MQSRQRFRIMLQLTLLLFILTVVVLLEGCAIQIADEEFCSPLPGGLGSVCDNFLTSNQQILTASQWEAKQALWASQGNATECTTSKTIGDIKKEIEKLCSVTKCNYDAQQTIISGLEKIQKLGK